MASGMGLTMTPMTELIMSSVPRDKAGVGSAMNDTTRQMGGAIGVAVFGSIMASHFTSSVTEKLAGDLPARVLSAVGNNVGQAIGIANDRRPPLSTQIAAAAKESFVSGLHIIGVAAAAITLIAVIGVLIFLPARATDEEPLPDDAREQAPVHAGVT
jgi:predicted MFS family arabinose efflux permease